MQYCESNIVVCNTVSQGTVSQGTVMCCAVSQILLSAVL